jgi:hypothetical protein
MAFMDCSIVERSSTWVWHAGSRLEALWRQAKIAVFISEGVWEGLVAGRKEDMLLRSRIIQLGHAQDYSYIPHQSHVIS